VMGMGTMVELGVSARGRWGKRLGGVVGACVVAVVLSGVLAAADAWGNSPTGGFPEYYRCIKTEKTGKVFTGEYAERECETRAQPAKTGKYELQEVNSGTFETRGKSATLLTHSAMGVPESVVCKRSISTGEFLDSDVYATDKVTLEGCVGNGEKKTNPCGNSGLETIETQPLFTTLVWLNKSETEAGLLLEGEAEQLASFECGAERVALKGYLVGAIENTKKGHTITFAINASKEQAHRSIWVFGAENVSLNMYTQAGASHLESTLQATQAQAGTGAY
jgi:hypothetical protein